MAENNRLLSLDLSFLNKGVMEEIEIPTEHLHEAIKEKTEEHTGKEGGKSTLYIAVSTALMAVLAAIAGLLAGHHSNEALIEQVKASDQWAWYQAKSIKAAISALNPVKKENAPTPEQVKKEGETIMDKAKEAEKNSELHLNKHKTLAAAVTLFQVAIAVSAISILTKKTLLWYTGVVIALAGFGFLIAGIL
jgi:hypothetical protein